MTDDLIWLSETFVLVFLTTLNWHCNSASAPGPKTNLYSPGLITISSDTLLYSSKFDRYAFSKSNRVGAVGLVVT